METNQEQGLVKPEVYDGEDKTANDYLGDIKGQAQEYGQNFKTRRCEPKITRAKSLRRLAIN